MIKKLKTKVFFILMISLSTVVIGAIIILAIINYNNTFNIARSTIDRFSQLPQKYERNFENLPNKELHKNEISYNETNDSELEKNKIFERFYRVDKSRNRKEKRYGLGLAIAKSIMENYKGKIDVICKEGITLQFTAY